MRSKAAASESPWKSLREAVMQCLRPEAGVAHRPDTVSEIRRVNEAPQHGGGVAGKIGAGHAAVGGASGRFPNELSQAVEIVDIVPGCEPHHFEIQFTGALERLSCDALRAPGDILKQPAMWVFEAEEVVPAIFARAEHNAFAWRGERACGRNEPFGRQCRTIGIQNHGGTITEIEQGLCRLDEAFAEIGEPNFHQTNMRRQTILEERRGTGRPECYKRSDVACSAARATLSMISRRNAVFRSAASIGVSGGDNRVLVWPGIDAFAMIAIAQHWPIGFACAGRRSIRQFPAQIALNLL